MATVNIIKKKHSYKYCIVPTCRSTTFKCPNKLFFHVPNNPVRRRQWCEVMKRDLIGPKSTNYVCEDHFDVDSDVENIIRYRLFGGIPRLRSSVCPHKYVCRNQEESTITGGIEEKTPPTQVVTSSETSQNDKTKTLDQPEEVDFTASVIDNKRVIAIKRIPADVTQRTDKPIQNIKRKTSQIKIENTHIHTALVNNLLEDISAAICSSSKSNQDKGDEEGDEAVSTSSEPDVIKSEICYTDHEIVVPNVAEPPVKRRKTKLDVMNTKIGELKDIVNSNENDECALFGKYIGLQLKKMTHETRTICQLNIQKLCSEALLNEIHEGTSRITVDVVHMTK
ncbi:uncharacterized protein LOC119840294 [Zerene cesonia]|uniref:uncharacterized protein LOC119840294 n=1 Tax=Zerene cesonia TaxID=33412 RepID=UPI0018E58D57|nr:uncharacterized protein LOC119840294 [Zerene cesonia]